MRAEIIVFGLDLSCGGQFCSLVCILPWSGSSGLLIDPVAASISIVFLPPRSSVLHRCLFSSMKPCSWGGARPQLWVGFLWFILYPLLVIGSGLTIWSDLSNGIARCAVGPPTSSFLKTWAAVVSACSGCCQKGLAPSLRMKWKLEGRENLDSLKSWAAESAGSEARPFFGLQFVGDNKFFTALFYCLRQFKLPPEAEQQT